MWDSLSIFIMIIHTSNMILEKYKLHVECFLYQNKELWENIGSVTKSLLLN